MKGRRRSGSSTSWMRCAPASAPSSRRSPPRRAPRCAPAPAARQEEGRTLTQAAEPDRALLQGVVAFTGRLASMKRADAFALLQARRQAARGVTKKTDVLVVGELGWPLLETAGPRTASPRRNPTAFPSPASGSSSNGSATAFPTSRRRPTPPRSSLRLPSCRRRWSTSSRCSASSKRAAASTASATSRRRARSPACSPPAPRSRPSPRA